MGARQFECAHSHTYRARSARRPHHGPATGRRRLSVQAVRTAGTAAAHRGHPAPRRGQAGPAEIDRHGCLHLRPGTLRTEQERHAGAADRGGIAVAEISRRTGQCRRRPHGPGQGQRRQPPAAPSTSRSPACAARSSRIRRTRAICKPCAARAICWRPTDVFDVKGDGSARRQDTARGGTKSPCCFLNQGGTA